MKHSRLLSISAIILVAVAVAIIYASISTQHAAIQTTPRYCSFNGTSFFSSNIIVQGNFTVSAYVNFTQPGILISQGEGNNSHAEWYLGIGGETNGMLGFGVFSNAPTGNSTTFGWRFATANVSYDREYWVVGVYNTTHVSLYVNGTEVSSTPTPYPPINDSHVTFIGRRTSAFYVNGIPSFEYFRGRASNIEVFSGALNGSQVALLQNGTTSIKPVLAYCNIFFSGQDS